MAFSQNCIIVGHSVVAVSGISFAKQTDVQPVGTGSIVHMFNQALSSHIRNGRRLGQEGAQDKPMMFIFARVHFADDRHTGTCRDEHTGGGELARLNPAWQA